MLTSGRTFMQCVCVCVCVGGGGSFSVLSGSLGAKFVCSSVVVTTFCRLAGSPLDVTCMKFYLPMSISCRDMSFEFPKSSVNLCSLLKVCTAGHNEHKDDSCPSWHIK